MKVVILAGGLGSRLSEETALRPKPMVEIGGRPMLWHILNIYSAFGFNDFVIAGGYKSEAIKSYFYDLILHHSDVVVDTGKGKRGFSNTLAPDWKVRVVDTGVSTLTAGRIAKLKEHLDSTFMVTYGDGVADVDIKKLVKFHKSHGKIATVTAVHPPPRFGNLHVENDRVVSFSEKPLEEALINGGFFVFEPKIFKYLTEDVPLERKPLERLTRDGELMAYQHPGFWHPMDTLRDKQLLDEMWAGGRAPWKVWK